MRKTFLIASILFVAASLSAKQYPDSIQQASKEEPNIAYGWNFEFAGGLGVGSYEYKQLFSSFKPGYDHHVTNKVNFPAWNAAVGISYYFVPWMGIGTGAQFSAYTNKAAVTAPWTQNGTDTYGDDYTMTAQPTHLNEYQNIYMLEIPFALKFRARPGVVGFTATAGMKLGIPMMNNYRLAKNGYMDNSVHYPFYDLTLKDVPTVVEDIHVPSARGKMEKSDFRTLNYAAYAEIGILIRIQQRVELALSAFANYYINDVLTHKNTSYGTTPLGFGVGQSCGEYDMPYNTPYNGVLRTQEVETLHPWSVGLKLGVQINANRTKAQRDYDRQRRKQKKQQPVEEKQEPVVEPTPVIQQPVQPDTVPVVVDDWAQRREAAMTQIRQLANEYSIDICKEFCPAETVLNSSNAHPTKQLDEMLSSSVIFFRLDDTIPILKPEDILNRIADVLRRHPDQLIQINGHACKLGQPSYNKRLAQRRAEAVAGRLRALGVNDKQMVVASLGSDKPFRYNGRHTLSKDRRVEILPFDITAEFEAVSANDADEKQVSTKSPAKGSTTEIVTTGTRLAQIARKHYGEYRFWVFIYEANKDRLSNPSKLPVGLKLIIPDLNERLNGMSKQEALQEAERLRQTLQ